MQYIYILNLCFIKLNYSGSPKHKNKLVKKEENAFIVCLKLLHRDCIFKTRFARARGGPSGRGAEPPFSGCILKKFL